MAQEKEQGARRSRGTDSYPRDRFDDVKRSGRTGAHRVTAQQRFTWQYLIAVLISVAVLTTAGIFFVNQLSSTGRLPELNDGGSGQEQSPDRVTPELDPEATVVILDGTSPDTELAQQLEPMFTDEQWGDVLAVLPAETNDVEISAIFYADPADEAAALGLAQKLGGLSAYSSSDYEGYDARLIVLLGSDYAGPGRE